MSKLLHFFVLIFLIAQCRYAIAQSVDIKKQFEPGEIIWRFSLDSFGSAPSSDAQGTIYVRTKGGILYALNSSGELQWQTSVVENGPFPSNYLSSPPMVGLEGNIYVTGMDQNGDYVISKFNAAGARVWQSEVVSEESISPLSQDKNGNIYFVNGEEYVSSMRSDGTVNWSIPLHATRTFYGHQPLINSRGNIIVQSYNGEFQSFKSDGTTKWTYRDAPTEAPMALTGDDGIIFVTSSSNMYAYDIDYWKKLDTNGNPVWTDSSGSRGGGPHYSTPLVGYGSVYYWLDQDYLRAYSSRGDANWSFYVSDMLPDGTFTNESLTLSENGTLYFSGYEIGMYAINKDGTQRWHIADADLSSTGSSILLTQENTIITSARNELVAIYDVHGGLAKSPWPKSGQNNQNTGYYKGKSIAFDHDGDRAANIVLRDPATGFQYVWNSTVDTSESLFFGYLSSDIPINGDFDGDGRADIAVYRVEGGAWLVKESSSGRIARTKFGGEAGDMPVPADYDNDGITDLAIYRPTTSEWHIRYSSNPSTTTSIEFGFIHDIPIPADFDGDGRANIAVHRPSSGEWIFLSSDGSETVSTFKFGVDASDIAVPGDYDGDDIIDFAVRHPDSGFWYIHYSSTNETYRYFFGYLSDDIPAQADYDGDGKTDMAFRRASLSQLVIAESGDSNRFVRMRVGKATDTMPAFPIMERMKLATNTTDVGNRNYSRALSDVMIEKLGYIRGQKQN